MKRLLLACWLTAFAAGATSNVVSTGGAYADSQQTIGRQGRRQVIVDQNPGKNGNIMVTSDDVEASPSVNSPIWWSTNGGATWSKFEISDSPQAPFIGAVRIVQDTVNYKIHVLFLDGSFTNSYTRLTPTYSGGDISGFTQDVTAFQVNDVSGSNAPATLIETIDALGTHHLAVFTMANNGAASQLNGMITTTAAAVSPAGSTGFGNFAQTLSGTTAFDVIADSTATTGFGYAQADCELSFGVAAETRPAGSTTPGEIVLFSEEPFTGFLRTFLITPVAAAHTYTIGTFTSRTGALNNFGTDHLGGLSVFLGSDKAIYYAYSEKALPAAWIGGHAYVAGTGGGIGTFGTVPSIVTNAGNVYICITAGTSAASGGPTTTAANITDGGAHWAYVGSATTSGSGIHVNRFNSDGTHTADVWTRPSTSTSIFQYGFMLSADATTPGLIWDNGSATYQYTLFTGAAWTAPATLASYTGTTYVANASQNFNVSGADSLGAFHVVDSTHSSFFETIAFAAATATAPMRTLMGVGQ